MWSPPCLTEAGGTGSMDGGRRYWAFLSYSHKDRDWANRLHRALESYAIPSRLIGRQTPVGPAPKRLRPIFKDREDLAASAELRERVYAALAQSSALIVICSPTAARSLWVEDEIVRFKALHGEARVFAAIAAGTPNASRLTGHEGDECFPPALRFHVDSAGALTDRHADLIAADLRPNGDGRKLAKLKLIAGILGLDLDDLVRRDAHRRAERLTALTAASVAGALAMGGLALAALASRNEARAQRAQAEGLVAFMLGDLRKKLEPTGRLDVLDAVGGRAMAYYTAQAAHGLDDKALGQRARVLHLLGEIQEKRGNLQNALRDFQEASATTAELLARRPDDGERVFNHAQSVYYVGEVADLRGQAQEALRAFLEYRRLAERLVAIDPSKSDWREEVADANINLGSLLLKKRRPEEALAAFRRALEIDRNLVGRSPRDPGLRAELAAAYAFVSDAEAMAGRDDAALDDRLAERRICEQTLAESPDDNTAAESLMVNQRGVARIYARNKRLPEAVAELIGSARAGERLIAVDRANVEYQSEAALSFIALGRTLLRQGALGPAAAAAKRGDDLAEGLVSKDKTVERWAGVQLGEARLLRIRVEAEAAKNPADCRRALAPAPRESARLLALIAVNPTNLPLVQTAAEAMLLDGDYRFLTGEPDQARAAWAHSRLLLARDSGGGGHLSGDDRVGGVAMELGVREAGYSTPLNRRMPMASPRSRETTGKTCPFRYNL